MNLILTLFFIFTSFCFAQDFWEHTNGPYGGGIECLAINSKDDIFAATRNGVFRSTDNGDSWAQINNGLTELWVSCLTINSNGDLITGTWGGGAFLSTNNGENWIQINNGLTSLEVGSLAINPDGDIIVGTWGGGVFRSSDNGENWTQINNGLINLEVGSIAINTEGHIFAGTNNGVFRTTDLGNNWTKIFKDFYTDGSYLGLRSFAINSSGDIFAGWVAPWCSGGVLRSTDNGETWIEINDGLQYHGIRSLTINANGDIFAGSCGYVFRSTNNGDNWTGNFLIDGDINSLAINSNGYIFAGTDYGVFRSLNTTTSVKSENNAPQIYTLEQNYPNPFNPSTTIKYSIPKQSNVTLTVFDILGSEVTILVNTELSQGNYEVEFDGSKLTSGIYFYRLQAGKFSQTKKMILLK